ncbi:MAG: hypothetical protein ACYS0K_04545 [Planctomycetota bacterium]|jgi:hypothetical protein
MLACDTRSTAACGSDRITPIRRRLNAVGGVLLVVLLSTGSRVQASDPGLPMPGARERIAKFREDARVLAKRLPTLDDLGPGWYRPWEVPTGVPLRSRSEDAYWRRFEVPVDWAQFFGLDDEEIVRLVRAEIDKIFEMLGEADAAAMAKIPPQMREVAKSPSAALSLILMLSIRKHTLLVHNSKTLAASIMQGASGHVLEAMKARLGGRPPEEVQALQVAGTWPLLKVLGADLRGLDYGEALRAVASEIRSVRRGTRMVYVRASRAALKETSRSVPEYVAFTIDLHILARDAIGKELPDVTEATLGRTRQRFVDSLEGAMRMTREMAGVTVAAQIKALEEKGGPGTEEQVARLKRSFDEYRKMRTPTAALELREFGDNAWVVALDLPKIQGAKFAAIQARLRVGHAVAHIEATGTFGKDVMLRHLDTMLAALEDSLEVFADD